MTPAEVRAAYVNAMRRLMASRLLPGAETYGRGPIEADGLGTRTGRPRKSAWPALAAALTEMGASAAQYMDFHFATVRQPPTPYHVLSPRALEHYRQNGLPLEAGRVKFRLANDASEFRVACLRWKRLGYADRKCWEFALTGTSDHVTISPLFRLLMLLQLGDPRLDYFLVPAAAQYAANAALYERHWAPLMTPPALHLLRTQAAQDAPNQPPATGAA